MSQTTSQILADNLRYYTNDVSKRCVESGTCLYWGKTLDLDTDGCFVGRLMTPEQRQKVDEFNGRVMRGGSHFATVMEDEFLIFGHENEFSDLLRKNVKLMMRFQYLHDNREFWNDEKGLSVLGQFELKKIIRDYSILDKKDFAEFLA